MTACDDVVAGIVATTGHWHYVIYVPAILKFLSAVTAIPASSIECAHHVGFGEVARYASPFGADVGVTRPVISRIRIFPCSLISGVSPSIGPLLAGAARFTRRLPPTAAHAEIL